MISEAYSSSDEMMRVHERIDSLTERVVEEASRLVDYIEVLETKLDALMKHFQIEDPLVSWQKSSAKRLLSVMHETLLQMDKEELMKILEFSFPALEREHSLSVYEEVAEELSREN
jgi:hypothetical protein